MHKLRALAIEVSHDQELQDILSELYRLGYEDDPFLDGYKFILADKDGSIIDCKFLPYSGYWKLTSLRELKEMDI